MWILLIEDDPSTARGIELVLKSAGYACDVKRTGEEGLNAVKLYAYDAILLDMMLPDVGGLEVLRRLRADRIAAPVLILSGLDEVAIKTRGLNSGADDYLTKPFDNRELLARIQAILRRLKGYAETVIRTGDLVVNLDTLTVEINGKRVAVTPKEYCILELLSQRQGAVLSKEAILDRLYGGIDEPETKIIDVFVCKLRKKLNEASGGKNYIETVWGRGYMLRAPMDKSDRTSQPNEAASRRAAPRPTAV